MVDTAQEKTRGRSGQTLRISSESEHRCGGDRSSAAGPERRNAIWDVVTSGRPHMGDGLHLGSGGDHFLALKSLRNHPIFCPVTTS
jgi:hypothetical protein